MSPEQVATMSPERVATMDLEQRRPMDLLTGAVWRCAATPPNAVAVPAALPDDLAWLPASVPGTSAGAVRDAEGRDAALALDHDALDWWFTTELAGGVPAGSVLVLRGLATVAEVWCGDELVVTTRSMFSTVEVELGPQRLGAVLALRCRALTTELGVRRPRGRWRSSLVAAQGLRHVRTTLLGRAPVLAGAAAPVGPWRGISLHPPTEVRVAAAHLQARLDGADGVLRVRLRVAGLPVGATGELSVGDTVVPVELGPGGELDTVVRLPSVARWWPWTHGAPSLHATELRVAGQALQLGPVGFRTVTVDRTAGGFALAVNGVPVFVRGAVWAPLDPVGHAPDPAGTRVVLASLVEAGLNVVRVPGTDVDPGEDFHRACAAAGVLVWQDVALATLDPVGHGETGMLLLEEVAAFARARAADPSLAVVSGGTETEQQPTLLGLPASARVLPVLDEIVRVVSELAPGVVTVTSSPSGGPLPTHVGTGVAHWFGVGGLPAAAARRPGGRRPLCRRVPRVRESTGPGRGGASLRLRCGCRSPPGVEGRRTARPRFVVGLRGRPRPLRPHRPWRRTVAGAAQRSRALPRPRPRRGQHLRRGRAHLVAAPTLGLRRGSGARGAGPGARRRVGVARCRPKPQGSVARAAPGCRAPRSAAQR